MNKEILYRSRILLVDDEPDNISTVEMVLSNSGAEVLLAENGFDGLQLFHQHHPDIVLTDIRMPRVNGWTLLETIRAEAGPNLPVIALTAYAQPEDEDRAMKAGFTGYLVKPLNLMTLVDDLVKIIHMGKGDL